MNALRNILCWLVGWSILSLSTLLGQAIVGPFSKRAVQLPDTGDVRVVAYPTDAEGYAWSMGWKTPVVFVRDSGWVWVDVTVDGRMRRDSVYFRVPCFTFPSQIVLDSESMYDCMDLRPNCAASDLYFVVYDRWGNELFWTRQTSVCWKILNTKGPMAAGVYYYVLSWREQDLEIHKKAGTVFVIR